MRTRKSPMIKLKNIAIKFPSINLFLLLSYLMMYSNAFVTHRKIPIGIYTEVERRTSLSITMKKDIYILEEKKINKEKIERSISSCNRAKMVQSKAKTFTGLVFGCYTLYNKVGNLKVNALESIISSDEPRSLNQAGKARKMISETASKLPGYGDADIYYPSYFAGNWDVTIEFADFNVDISATTPSELETNPFIRAEIEKATKEKGNRISFPMNYIKSSDGNHIIADRGRNEAEFLKSYYKTLT